MNNISAPAGVDLPLDVTAIEAMLPHRYPFLMLDRIIGLEPGHSVTAIKNVTRNEPFFQGHFPGHPVMPGVLIVEALAQAAGVLIQLSAPETTAGMLFYLVKVDKARFARPVVPGDQLRLDVQHKRRMRNMSLFLGCARVGDQLAAEAEVLCAAVPRE